MRQLWETRTDRGENAKLNESVFDRYLKVWALTIDGDPFASLNGQLLPVRHGDIPAMLKVSHSPEEQVGIICEAAHIDRQRLMQWALAWAGLSATWMMEDGVDPVGRFELAKLAALLLDGSA